MDFKALRAKFHAQAERATSSGGAYSKPHMAGHFPETVDNGMVRGKPSPTAPKPVLPVNLTTEPKRISQIPHGVFPRPPPTHRVGSKEDLKPVVKDSDNARRVKQTGERLQNMMIQHHEKQTHSLPRPLLPSQKSISEVVPLRKPLPNVGQRPTKPKRPPFVNLDRFRAKGTIFQSTVHQDIKTPEGEYFQFIFYKFPA